MASIKVKHRLTLGFGLLVVVIAASMGVAVLQIRALRDGIAEISTVHVPRAKAANDVIDGINSHARAARTLLLADTPDLINDQMRQADGAAGPITAAMNQLETIQGSAQSMQLYETAKAARVVYRSDAAQFMSLFKAGRHEDARKFLLGQMRPDQLAYMTAVENLIHQEEGQTQDLATQTMNDAISANLLLSISGLVALLVAVLAGWLITRSLMRELGGEPAEAVKLMEELASGEVTTTLTLRANDHTSLFANLSKAAAQAIENIRIRKALDAAAANIMIADSQNKVVYMNNAVAEMFRSSEADIRKDIPNFSSSQIVGSSMDSFHRNPQHQERLMAGLRQTHRATIEVGGHTFGLNITPVFGKGGGLLGSTLEWLDRSDELAEQAANEARQKRERELAAENARIRSALDNVSTSVMIADTDRKIIYMNRSSLEMMSHAESDIRKDLPNFDARNLLGGSIDDFHKNPAHQRDLLANLRSTYKAQISVGGRTFALAASPVFDADGARLGAAVEWADRTLEVQVENEVAQIVGAAALGDFDQRVVLDGKEGFFKVLGQAINQLVDVTSRGLQDIATVLSAVARGDLTHSIHNDYQGLFGILKQDTNTTVERLREIVQNIKEATDAINTAAREISAGNTNLSSRTEQQAASLEETASSMEEITSTVRQNADNAKKANVLAIGSSGIATRGGKVVGQVVATMSEINESAKKIVDIISVIDGIAFQTNILAFNAAVEAARAGEQGRGFAVVASEVRNLAQRSAGAAKEIKGLIGDSVDKVESGSRLVDEAGRTMDEIVTSITSVTDIMSEISAASMEQSSGIEQVNLAVTQMDENTQKNAALVEQAAAAAESLEEQARNLADAVALFKLKDTVEHRRPSAQAKPAAPVTRVAPRPAATIHALPVAIAKDEAGEWEEF